jgi:hypothetical protein
LRGDGPLAARDPHIRLAGRLFAIKNRTTALRNLLDESAVGFGPWILLSMVEGPGRQVVPVCGLAGALALLTCAAGVVIGLRPDLPNVTAMSSSLA